MTIELLLALAIIVVTGGFVFAFFIYHKSMVDLTNKLMSRTPEDYLIMKNADNKNEPDVTNVVPEDETMVPLSDLDAAEVLEAAAKGVDHGE